MSLLVHTSTHKVEHLRRGLYQLTVFDRNPRPGARHIVEWHHGNRRGAFDRLAALLQPPQLAA